MKHFLSRIRDIYNLKKHLIENFLKWFEAIAFILTLLITVFGIKKLITEKWPNPIDLNLYLEIFETIIDLILTTYFFIFGLLRLILPQLLDPMTTFYKTLESIRKKDYGKPANLRDFTIKSQIEEQDITKIDALANLAWGRERFQTTTRAKIYNKWRLSNPEIFSLILFDNEPIGYIAVLPLNTDEFFEQILSKKNIDKGNIESYHNSATFIFVESIYLKKQYQRDEILIHHIYYEVLKKIKLFASDGLVKIYSQAYYLSYRNFFINNGFGSLKKKEGKLEILYIPIENYKELDIKDDRFKFSGCNSAKLSFFFKSFDFVCKDVDNINKTKKDQLFTMMPFVTSVNRFFETSFRTIQPQPLIDKFLNKTYTFYTHSVYRDKNIRKHSLAISYISFDVKPHKNFIACKFHTGTKVKNKEYVYNGICMFSNEGKDILMICHPGLIRTETGVWTEHTGNLGDPTVIITGRILRRGEVDIKSRDNNGMDKLLSLNLTTFSQHTKNTISKIGLLHMKDVDDDEKIFFKTIQINNDDEEIIKTIKLYLMRSNKVIIKGMSDEVINNKGDIDEWIHSSYKALSRYTNNNYELYYYKKNNNNLSVIGAAYINFMKNGIARLTRTKKIDNKDIIEQYFGEVNIRYNEANKKFLYIKFIEMDRGDETIHQHYRELFLILFWPGEDQNNFDYTRGIMMGDKDDDKNAGNSVISANICVLCNATSAWNKKMNNTTGKKDTDLPFKLDKLKRVDESFLSTILKKSVYKESHTINSNFDDTIDKVISDLEIRFDGEQCEYKF